MKPFPFCVPVDPHVDEQRHLELIGVQCSNSSDQCNRRRTLVPAPPLHGSHASSRSAPALPQMKDTGLTETPYVARVREDYLQSFRELQETRRPHDRDQVAAFTKTVERVQALGDDTVLLMACGLQDLLRRVAEEKAGLERVQDFLDDFYQV